jgi:uncharacterized membrane protein YfcA
MQELAILVIVCVLTYSFEIVYGLAGTIIMVTVLSAIYDAKTLVIYSVLPQILVGTIGLWRSPRTVDVRVLGSMLVFAVIGALTGLVIFYRFPEHLFRHVLAGAITLFGILLVARPHPVALSPLAARSLDVLAGASQALFGISGPVAMARLMATWHDKTIVRNYALAFFLSLNIVRAATYTVRHTFTPEILQMMWVSAPFLAVTLWTTNHLHFRVPQGHFRQVVSWAILIGGVTLFFR